MIADTMWSLVRRAAKGLRYQTVSPLIGQRLVVGGWSSFENDVESWVETQMPGCQGTRNDEAPRRYVYAKYRFADFRFDATELTPDAAPVGGIRLLKGLGFAWNRRPSAYKEGRWIPEYADPSSDSQEYVEDLVNDIEQKGLYLLVFVSRPEMEEEEDWRRFVREPELLEFPVMLEVVDACLTNSPGVWINKHFYL